MPPTPHLTIRLPLYLKKAIQERTKNVSAWIIEAIQEKLKKSPQKP